MARANKRQTKREQTTKCEYFNCSSTFGRKCDRKRHMVEQHRPCPLYCSYPGCSWFTKRAGKLRDHWRNDHHRQITANLIIPPEFRIAPAHSQGSTNHFSPHEANINFDANRPTPPEFTDYTFTTQGQPEIADPHSALINEFSPSTEDILTFRSSVTSRRGVQGTPCYVYDTCRISRRWTWCPPHPTPPPSSASPSRAQLSHAKEPTADVSFSEQSSTSLFAQWMQCACNVEPLSGFLDSLRLDFSIDGTWDLQSDQL